MSSPVLQTFTCSAVCAGQPIKTVWVWPVGLGDEPLQAPRFLYYSHGGCYCLGSPGTHLLLLCQLAKDTGAAVFAGVSSPQIRLMNKADLLN